MSEPDLCSGCGALAPRHPYVGVTRDDDGRMAAFPICAACYADPTHRQRVLKVHYFRRDQAPAAVDAAERNILVEPPS